ncbi:MAG: hemerythrin domain-containing protein [Candidatus Hydrogenedentes bacterium]|nr:hemerythrin domain-containing protein [Candidatus Hydrogenedentota bacterium]
MRAADVLVNEHDTIMKVVDAARNEAARISATGKANSKRIREMTEFFRDFVDACHHGKEEQDYFPRLEARGIPRVMGPIGCMLTEHGNGRDEVRGIADALNAIEQGDSGAAPELARHLQAYADLLTAHIQKENDILFMMGDNVLTAEDQADLVHNFDITEEESIGHAKYKRYQDWAKKLER